MAPFTKYIQQTNDPTYLGYSKEIEAAKPNTTYGKLFSGIGDTLSGGLKGATDWLDIKINEDAKAESDQFNKETLGGLTLADAATLGKLKNKVDTGGLLDAQGSSLVSSGGGAATLLAGKGQNEPVTPPEVSRGISDLDRIYQQYQAGMLSPTYLQMRQQVIAQQLKQRFPGSEKEVDAALHRETSSANAIRAGIFADFQAAATAANTANKDWTHNVRANAEILGEAGVAKALSPEVMHDKNKQVAIDAFIAGQKNSIYQMDTRLKQLNLKKTEGTLQSEDAEKSLTLDLQGMTSRAAAGALSPLTGLREKIDKATSTGEFTADDLNTWRGQVAEMRRVLDDAFTSHINNPNLAGGNSYNSIIPDKAKIAAIRKTATESLDHIDDALNNKDPKVGVSLASWHLKDMETRVGMGADQLIQKSNTARALASTEKALGGQGNITSKILIGNKALTELWRDVSAMSAGNAMQGKSNISEMVQPKEGQKPPAQVLNQTMKNTETIIIDPQSPVEMRKNAVKYLVNDTDGKFFKEFDRPSQMQAYGRLTSPQISKSVFDLADPKLSTDYTQWSQRTYNSIANGSRGDIGVLLENKQLSLQYDPKSNRLVWNQVPQDSRLGVVNYPELQVAIRLNNGLSNLDTIHKLNGTSASDQLAPLFQGMGIPIKQEAGKTPQRFEDTSQNRIKDTFAAVGQAIKDGTFDPQGRNNIDPKLTNEQFLTQGYKINPTAWEEWLQSGPWSTNIEDARNQPARGLGKGGPLGNGVSQPQFVRPDKPLVDIPAGTAGGVKAPEALLRERAGADAFTSRNNVPRLSDEQLVRNMQSRIRSIEYDRRLDGKPEGGYPPHGELSRLRREVKEMQKYLDSKE